MPATASLPVPTTVSIFCSATAGAAATADADAAAGAGARSQPDTAKVRVRPITQEESSCFMSFFRGACKKGSHSAALLQFWSGRRVSNSRPQPWQGCALPTELLPQKARIIAARQFKSTATRGYLRPGLADVVNHREQCQQHRDIEQPATHDGGINRPQGTTKKKQRYCHHLRRGFEFA